MPDVATVTRTGWRRLLARTAGLVALALGLGALAGVVWWWLTDLPSYLVGPDGGASTSERGLAQVLGSDAWFTGIGVVVGLLLGILAWRRLRGLGWGVVLAGPLTALAAALVCWAVGHALGPGEFTSRLAAAKPGDRVPIVLTLQARASLLVWPFLAVVPILLGSSLGRDEEDLRAGPERSAGDDGA